MRATSDRLRSSQGLSAARQHITPLVLTYNEEANVKRTLDALSWSERVIVVDSGSTDQTQAIVRQYPNATLFVRPFESHSVQWTFAVRETGIRTTFVLALDADMVLSADFPREFGEGFLASRCSGGLIPIVWSYFGKPLLGSLCRPQLRIFRPESVDISQYGHTQAFRIDGPSYGFRSGVLHDDRKPLERWIQAQAGYSRHEHLRLVARDRLRTRDRIRLAGWMPPIAAVLSYLRAGGPFGGRASVRYALERAVYESLLAIRLADEVLRPSTSVESSATEPPTGQP